MDNQSTIRIKNFPISFFSVVMGLSGLTIALFKTVDVLGVSNAAPVFFLYTTVLVFVAISVLYLIKSGYHFDEVKKEFNHPIRLNFFPAFSISLLLLSVAFLTVNLEISKFLWVVGASVQFVITLLIIGFWMHHDKYKIAHLNPSWFIPAVGNILVPVAGVAHFNAEISWFFFSYGLFFWVILMTIFFYRIFFHERLEDKMLPTLFILIAPPAVGFISYYRLTETIDSFAKVLYYFALFLTILMLSQLNVHAKIKYYLSWWAYSFPLAAISIATAVMYIATKVLAYKYLFLSLLVILVLTVILLVYKTIFAISNKQICVEE